MNPLAEDSLLMQEIILRGFAHEPEERPEALDLRAAFKTPSLDDSDYLTPLEQVAWLGKTAVNCATITSLVHLHWAWLANQRK